MYAVKVYVIYRPFPSHTIREFGNVHGHISGVNRLNYYFLSQAHMSTRNLCCDAWPAFNRRCYVRVEPGIGHLSPRSLPSWGSLITDCATLIQGLSHLPIFLYVEFVSNVSIDFPLSTLCPWKTFDPSYVCLSFVHLCDFARATWQQCEP